VTIADAMLDRLLERTHRITLKGEKSLRNTKAEHKPAAIVPSAATANGGVL